MTTKHGFRLSDTKYDTRPPRNPLRTGKYLVRVDRTHFIQDGYKGTSYGVHSTVLAQLPGCEPFTTPSGQKTQLMVPGEEFGDVVNKRQKEIIEQWLKNVVTVVGELPPAAIAARALETRQDQDAVYAEALERIFEKGKVNGKLVELHAWSVLKKDSRSKPEAQLSLLNDYATGRRYVRLWTPDEARAVMAPEIAKRLGI